MMKWILTYGAAACAVVAATWAAGDYFGFRPAFKLEVTEVKKDVEELAGNVNWIRLDNYERRIKRGQALGRRECAKYYALCRQLKVRPLPCR